MMRLLILMCLVCPWPVLAAGEFVGADVVVLGELHDNPHHHARQARIVAAVAPRALVFEMLTEAQAEAHVPGADADTLAAAFGWADSGWPDFAMYHPIFAAAPDARVFGAGVPRTEARQVMEVGLARVFHGDAAALGLTDPLLEAEQAEREAMQMAAHCNALPEELLPMMVDIQRLRDAELARVTAEALALTGGPVAVITGNGHAREDWGMPVYLARVAPDIRVVTLGQGETDAPVAGLFDVVETSPPAERDDPCAAFR